MKNLKKLLSLIFVIFFCVSNSIAAELRDENESINVAILGYGTVGSGVYEIINNNSQNIKRWSGKSVTVKKIFVRESHTELLNSSEVFTSDFETKILDDDTIKIVVEAMGGIEPANTYIRQCLERKKSVVTANKQLVAEYGTELLKIARENNVSFKFEASVGGGIPVIEPLLNSLNANNINSIYGILNGTTNFILDKMKNENLSFDEALKIAQKFGYAEADPTADVDGLDARNKICILSSIAYGIHFDPQDVYAEGISNISIDDIKCADKLGYVIKLIACAKKEKNDKISIFVSPMLVSKSNPLSTVEDVFNAILIDGDCTGKVMFYGRGAGKLPTASAVVSDIIYCINNIGVPQKIYWKNSNVERNDNYCKLSEYKWYVRFMEDGTEKTIIAKDIENKNANVISKIMILD